ncbi:MAG: UvrD-helicase domain-containing protein [Firmicutes bacterium]|nr:UvrD-helicase domain-containing protein [Bacillota bacterium]
MAITIAVDAEARWAARTAKVNVLVEAGAGTGKTTLLVDRVMEALWNRGVPLSRMLLITFMDKAQQEMRDRLAERLSRLEQTAERPQDQARCAALLDQVPEADITTIHGLCYRLLSEFGADYGIPVGFQVLDDIDADRLWADAFRAWSQEPAYQSEILQLLQAGLTWSQLVSWARQITRWRSVPSYEAHFPDVKSFVVTYREAARRFAARAQEGGASGDAGVAQIRDIERHFRWIADMPERDWPRILAQWTTGLAPKGNKKNWLKPDWLAEQKIWIQSLRDELQRLRVAMADSYLATWLRLIGREFLPYWREVRFRLLSLTYDDLLWEAERITRIPAVWGQINRRYDLVMVDEFQDTDPVQAAIIRRLVTPVGSERLTPGDQGRLFLVGDPKQSIYRFRGADVETYAEMREEIQATGGMLISITQNFRSHPAILTVVNQYFQEIWPAVPDPARPYVPPFAPLVASYPDDDKVRVQVVAEALGEPARVKRRREAAAIADLIATAVEEGWPVRGADGTRPISFGDIALIVPQRTGLYHYREALSGRQIPVASHTGRGFFQQDEIRGLRHLFCALADPLDGGAVVGWLLSPWVGLTHEILAEHRARGGSWDYRSGRAGHPEVVTWFQRLTAWHGRFWRVDPETVLDWAVAASPLESVLAERGDAGALANLRQMRTLCRQLGDRWGMDVFTEWLDVQVREEVPFDEAPVAPVDDAVVISTVHQAKGLEWPMVIVANWKPHPTHLESGIQYSARLQRVALHQDPWVSRDWVFLEADHRLREEAEGDRLLYVALTRARDYLWFYTSFLADQRQENE